MVDPVFQVLLATPDFTRTQSQPSASFFLPGGMRDYGHTTSTTLVIKRMFRVCLAVGLLSGLWKHFVSSPAPPGRLGETFGQKLPVDDFRIGKLLVFE